MGLLWHAAYIKFTSSETTAKAIRQTMEVATNYRFRLAPPDSRISYDWHACAGNLLCVSPQENDWVGVWGSSNRFHTLIMEQNRFSGILLDREEEDYWQYSLWRDGAIMDWFVSSPKHYFSMWREEAINAYVKPYLAKRGITSDDLGWWQTIQLIDKNAVAFRGDIELLRPFVKPHIREATIREWLQLRPTPAFDQVCDIVVIPFAGTDYHAIPIGIYFDVRRDVTSLMDGDERIRDTYQWCKERLSRVDEFKPLAFEFPEGTDFSSKYNDDELAEVFYWGP